MAENKNIEIKQDKPEAFRSDLDSLKEIIERISRMTDRGFVTDNGSVVVREDGQVNLSSQKDNQLKLTPNGTAEMQNYQTIIRTNRLRADANDIIVNNHKLNNKLYELADFKSLLTADYNDKSATIGGLTMLGTVLTKAWDPHLERYVLIRRLTNMPVFSPSMGNTDVLPGLKITPDISAINALSSIFGEAAIPMLKFVQKYIVEREEKDNAQEQTDKNASSTTPTSMTNLTGQKN